MRMLAAVCLVVIAIAAAGIRGGSDPPASDPAPKPAASKTDETPPIDTTLTAEQVFAANYKDQTLVRGLYSVGPLEGIDARKLSEAESRKYQGRFARGELADLVLFQQRCKNIVVPDVELARAKADFEKLPEDLRKEALDHEIDAIEKVPDYERTKGQWHWFCAVMSDGIISGTYNDLVTPFPELSAKVTDGAIMGPNISKAVIAVMNRSSWTYATTMWSCAFFRNRALAHVGIAVGFTTSIRLRARGRPNANLTAVT
jgi:hypothetical protein